MRRMTALLLAGLAALTLTGCRRGPGLLPYAREIEDMELMQTLGVDRAGEGQVEVTASSGSGDPAEGAATVVSGQAGTISAAVLGMQGEGSSYLYFGHVGQLLLGEGLARQGVEPALDYILRDVETRLDTALYLVRGGTAGKAITAAGEDGSAADRLEALAEDAGLLAGSMPRTVKDALSDLYAQGATFLPAVEADEALTAAGYGILKGDRLAGWAEGDAALGVNLVLGQVDADVVELPLDGGGVAALRVVGARTPVHHLYAGRQYGGGEFGSPNGGGTRLPRGGPGPGGGGAHPVRAGTGTGAGRGLFGAAPAGGPGPALAQGGAGRGLSGRAGAGAARDGQASAQL